MKRSGITRKTGLARKGGSLKRSGPPRARKGFGRTDTPPRAPSSLRAGGRRKNRPPEGPLTPVEWLDAVYRLGRGRSVASGRRVKKAMICAHHAVPKRLLRDLGRHDVVWDPRNGVLVTEGEHDDHERANRRIPYDALPQRVIDFATEVGERALDHLRTYYPPEKEEPRVR